MHTGLIELGVTKTERSRVVPIWCPGQIIENKITRPPGGIEISGVTKSLIRIQIRLSDKRGADDGR